MTFLNSKYLRAACVVAVLTVGVVATTASGETDTGSSSDTTETTAESGSDRDVSQGLGSADASGDIVSVELDRETSDVFNNVLVTVKNNSEKRSNYSITVVAESPDGATRYGETYALVTDLEPGQTTTARTFFDDELPADAVLKATEVQRTASAGEQGLGSEDASGDVSEPQLVRGEYGLDEVLISVTNNSEKRSDYVITIVAESLDGTVRYDDAFVMVTGLEPGQTSEEVGSLDSELIPDEVRLRTVEVQRTAS